MKFGLSSSLKPMPERMVFVVLKYTTSSKVHHQDAVLSADISKSQSACHVGTDCLGFVRLAPVDTGSPGYTSSIEDMGRLNIQNILQEG